MVIIQKIKAKGSLSELANGREKSLYSLLLIFWLGAVLISANPNAALAQWSVSNYKGFELPSGTIRGIVENFLKWLLLIFGFIGIIGFVISGVMYLTAAGDEDQQKRAKKAMYYSIIGVIVGLAGLVVLQAAVVLLKGSSPDF